MTKQTSTTTSTTSTEKQGNVAAFKTGDPKNPVDARGKKVVILRDALALCVDALRGMSTIMEGAPKKEGAAYDLALKKGAEALDATVGRATMTPEQKAVAKAQRRFEQGHGRILSWLRGVGIKKDGYGVHKVNGLRVKFIGDPIATPTGYSIACLLADGTTEPNGDAMAFRPDYAAIDLATASTPKRATRKAQEEQSRKTTTAKR